MRIHQLHIIKGLVFCFFLLSLSCTKEETIIVPDNNAPNINNVPTIKIENFVNRTFIDIIGREPLDEEMQLEVTALREAELSTESRIALVAKLQSSTEPVPGDTTYLKAYSRQLYNLAKIRCVEGFSDERLLSEFAGTPEFDSLMQLVVKSREELEAGTITINEVFGRMVHNAAYDQINMNTFNFVNATFDNLLWRFPTSAEFNAGFDMVEFGNTATLFGQTGQTKDDYIQIIINSREMYEGLIIWVYQQLLARRPTTEETAALLNDFIENQDFRKIQQIVMATNEYANF